jgi:anaerobic selenocysteine-containing dehydrogenase
MALIHTLIAEDLVDRDYVERYTVGFDGLAARAASRTPAWAESVTGVPAADIRRLAREYATTRPAAIRMGVALERHHGGGQTVRAVCCLPALTGAWRDVGGGILAMPVWEHPYRFDAICRPDWIPAGTRVINNLQIGRHLTGRIPMDPPILSMMVWNSNPVTQSPESDLIIEGLMREDLFLVVADHFMVDTARYADIVLPAAMGAEMEDIILSWGHNYLTWNEKCVEPPGEALSNREIFRRLAARMGYTEPEFRWSDAECLEHFIDWDAPACRGITLATLREHGYAHLSIGGADDRAPHREGNFPTPSGKCEFRSGIAAQGNFVAGPFRQMYAGRQGGEPLDDLPDYVPPRESPATNPSLAARYPLNIVSPKSHAFLNSCYANMEGKQRAQGEQFLLINAADAGPRGIGDGARVQVHNDRGVFEALASVTDDVNPGVVVATLGYWRQLNRGTVNVVSSAEFVNMGHAPSFSDNLVEVTRVVGA